MAFPNHSHRVFRQSTFEMQDARFTSTTESWLIQRDHSLDIGTANDLELNENGTRPSRYCPSRHGMQVGNTQSVIFGTLMIQVLPGSSST